VVGGFPAGNTSAPSHEARSELRKAAWHLPSSMRRDIAFARSGYNAGSCSPDVQSGGRKISKKASAVPDNQLPKGGTSRPYFRL